MHLDLENTGAKPISKESKSYAGDTKTKCKNLIFNFWYVLQNLYQEPYAIIHTVLVFLSWYILSGKIGRKILPLKLFSYFLIINTGLVQVHYSHFWALWTPGGLWGALGWFGGV